MNNAFELLVGSLGAGACWMLWFYFVKEQRVDALREELFIIRNDLFCMAAAGHIAFESTSYVELRYLINGMLRFGHHISLRSSFIASRLAEIDPDKSSAYVRWKMSVDGEPEDVQKKLLAIHHRMFWTYVNYLVNGSLTLTMLKCVFLAKAGIKTARTTYLSKKRPTRFDLIDIAVNKIANSVHAQALEEQAYRGGQNDSQDLQIA